MRRTILVLFLLLIRNFFLSAQSLEIKGKVLDSDTHIPLEGVNIYDSTKSLNAVSDKFGNFVINYIPSKKINLTFSSVGYLSRNISLNLKDSAEYKTVNLVPAPVTMGEVTVLSTRAVRTVREIPLPIEIVNRDLIQQSTSITAPDLLSTISGIAIQRDGIWATSINLRGFGSSSLVMLIDGNRIETATDLAASLSLIDLNDVERVEVIKGSASSLYGTGALGGVVNFISKAPEFTEKLSSDGSVSTYYNSVNEGYSENLNLNLKRDSWYFRVNGTLRKALNTKTPSGVLDNSQYSDDNISTLLEISPLKDHLLKINYQNYKAHDVGIPGGYPLFPNNADVKYSKVQRDLFSAEYRIKNISRLLNNLLLKYYNQNMYRYVNNVPNSPVQHKPLQNSYVQEITPNARHYTNGIQLQANLIPDSSQIITAGVDIWQRKIDSRRERDLKIDSLNDSGSVKATYYQIFGERPLPEASFTSAGIFAQDDFILNENIKLMLGGRVDKINVSNSAVSNPVYIILNGVRNNSPSNQTLYWKAYDANDISWSGNIGIIYSFTKKLDLTFNAGRSFRSPSLEERYQYIDLGSLLRIGNPNLNPERGYFFDLGFRIWDESFSMKWDSYLNLLSDLVSEIPDTYEDRPALIKTNIGKARLYGSDFSMEYNAFQWGSLYSDLSYTIGKDVINNLYLPQIPPLNGTLGFKIKYLECNFDLSAKVFAAQSKVAAGEIKTPGYAYFDLFIQSPSFNISLAEIRIYGGIENLTNKSYRNHLSTNRGFIKEEPGRNFFLKLKIGW